jgi:hypothetical protein
VRGPCEACAVRRRSEPKQAASNVTFFQIGVTYVTLPIFQGFSGVFGRLALKKQSDRKQIYN